MTQNILDIHRFHHGFRQEKKAVQLLKLPKLKIKSPSQNATEDICDFQDAKYRFNWCREPFLILVEKQPIGSYEELVELVKLNRFEGREFLEVELQPLLAGG